MRSVSKEKKEFTLTKLKDQLYTGNTPILYSRKKGELTEDLFLGIVFPEEFYTAAFEDGNGREYSLEKLLTKRGNNASQRNRIFNRKYTGYTLRDNVVGILGLRPEIWDSICQKCKMEISKASDPSRLNQYIQKLAGEDVKSAAFRAYLLKALEEEPGNALAAAVVYLLLDGKVDELLPLFNSTESYAKQFRYMERACPMLKRSFGKGVTVSDFSGIVKKNYNNFSELFSYVATVKADGEPVRCDHLLNFLYQNISSQNSQKLIYISGPAGTEKNAITQLLYLKLACDTHAGKNDRFAPHYVNLNYYRRLQLDSLAEIKDRLQADFSPFLEYCNAHPKRTPVLFVDGVKNYTIDGSNIDYSINQYIEDLPNVRLIVAAENGAMFNTARQRRTPAFAAGSFQCQVTIDSLYLPGSETAQLYLDKFQEIYHPGVKSSIYESLRRLGINSIDTFQLRMLALRLGDAADIAELYETVCLDSLNGDRSEFTAAAQWAFDFAYTDSRMPPISGRLRELLCAHESIQEYFIARWYLSKIREGTMKDNIGSLNMVMPKGVTRFIVPMLNHSAADEARVLDLIEHNYQRMDLMAKSEMTYWLGRIKSTSMADWAERLLEQYYEAQKADLDSPRDTDKDYKRKLFLMRGISVSLIVKGHRDVSQEYIVSLIHNSTANEINRGFHLEYYGDKAYLPAYNTLDFKDDLTQGKRTLDQLISANELSMNSGALPPIFELNLFTICSLLQARVERADANISFELTPYLKKACKHIRWYLQHAPNIAQILKEYLLMAERDFQQRIENEGAAWGSVGAEAYTVYSKRVNRTGWVDRGIQMPETVAEHMYHVWMMGMMFLPEVYSGNDEYSKTKILNLLLI